MRSRSRSSLIPTGSTIGRSLNSSSKLMMAEAGAVAASALDEYAGFLEGLRDPGNRRLRPRRGALRPPPPREGARPARRRGPPRARAPGVRAARGRAPAARAARGRHRRLAGGPAGPEPGSPRVAGGDAPGLRGLDGARPPVPSRPRARLLPGRRGVPRGAVSALPAPRAGGGVVLEPTRLLPLPPRPLLRPVPDRRRLGRGGPPAAREQQPRRHPHDRGPRSVPGPPLALRHDEGASEPDSPDVRHSVLQRGLGPLRRAHDAGAGVLRGSSPRAQPGRGDALPRGTDRRRHDLSTRAT